MESQSKAFDDTIKFEKERAIASFNRLRAVMRLWHFAKVAAAFAFITWCSPLVVSFSTRVFFNQHVVFLIGNAIIISLVMLCRRSAAAAERRDAYDEYVRYGEAARAPPPQEAEEEAAATVVECDCDGGPDKQIVYVPPMECDDVAVAIERATEQIRRFERTHSEALRREISVRPELRRSETTESYREVLSSEAVEIEKLSNEEFRQTVDEFIHKYWTKGKLKLEGDENYRS